MNVPQQQPNPSYTDQQHPYMVGPTGYNYPPQPVYGPIGVAMPHQYHPQVNWQLPFLATLDLPDLSRLTNDPILHFPFWPVIPAKLPSDIPKFDGKPIEDLNNHVMTFHLWCLLALDQVLNIIGHFWTLFGTSTGCWRRSASRSEDRRILAPCLGIFGFWDYVTGMGMSAHGFTHV